MRAIVFEGYFEVGGVEVLNNARTVAYAAGLGIGLQCDGCPGLPAAAGDQAYLDPQRDQAPWWDPVTPESRRFAGVLGLDVQGLSSANWVREPTQLLHDGAVLGAARRPHKEISVSALLVAADDCALSYGISWLTAALRDSLCADACQGEQLCFFSCCPVDGDSELRSMFDVGLLAGPAITEKTRRNGGVLATVEWTWVAGKPWLFLREVHGGGVWRTIGADGRISVFPLDDDCPDERVDCADDPFCERPPLPPLPPVPRDPCYPLDGYIARRAVFSVPVTVMPAWKETVPVIDIQSGDKPLRRVGVRFQINPTGLSCVGELAPCSACEEITIPYIPANSALRIDGRIQRASIDCPGGTGAQRAPATLYGKAGSVFTWPVLEYNGGLCVEVYADETTVSDRTSRARLYLVPREDAA